MSSGQFLLLDCYVQNLVSLNNSNTQYHCLMMIFNNQTKAAKEKGESNCPLCAVGHDANKNRIWKLTEMDADHVEAWSKGGATDESNCQMLCKTHNRAKGNR